MPNIYLIGMMGSGKSVTGKELARLASCPFVDLDERIEKQAHKTIAEIFKEKGEDYFRDLEQQMLREAAGESGQVIATGGGVILREENARLMNQTGKVIFLKASVSMLWGRVEGNQNRPLLAGENPRAKLEEIYRSREKLYLSAASEAIETDGKTPAQVAAEIREKDKGTS